MRKPIIAGNWKMNMTPAAAKELVSALIPLVKDAQCDVVVCPPSVDIAAVAEVIKGTNIHLGAQNVHWKESGAYTGEVSTSMLKELGVEYCIVGHSERRAYFADTDETVNLRANAALNAGITPIICVGETLEQREAGETEKVVKTQTVAAFKDMTKEQAMQVVIAYEPIWAIGTGKTATNEEADETIAIIRATVASCYDKATADAVRIQYGGSMNPKNCDGLMAMANIDGGLIGGASLKAPDFAAICASAK